MTSKWGELGAQMASIVLGSRAAAPAPSAEASTSDFVRQEGVVADWNPRGFGFIHFTDGRRAYVHNSACGGEHLHQGETVTAICVADAQNPGKWAAHEVQRMTTSDYRPAELLAVAAAAAAAVNQASQPVMAQPEADSTRQQGVVTEWNARGFGFIQFADGRRAYVHNSQCGGEHLLEGETVTAACVDDVQNPGKWAAMSVQRECDGEEGVVSEWKEDGGFGFLNMTDGRRAYVHRSAFGGKGSLTPGTKLKVTTKPDPRNVGKWCVAEIKQGAVLDNFLDNPSPNFLDNPSPVMPASTQRDNEIRELLQAEAMYSDNAVRSATVSEWDPRGFGFVKTDDGRRAYIHNSSAGGEHLQVGEIISAQIVPDPQNPGKWAALNVQRGLSTGEMGTVSEWHEAGGYGFFSMDDGRRAYVHRNAFGGKGSLTVGARMSVTTKPDPRNPGKWCVGEVRSDLGAGEQAQAGSRVETGGLGMSQPQQPSEGGTVSEWHEAGGYGFLSMDDGRRAYIHRNAFGGKGSLVVGSKLQVTTKPDPRNAGKWCVGQVLTPVLGSGSAANDLVGLLGELGGALGSLINANDKLQEQASQAPQTAHGGQAAPQQPEDGVVQEWREEGGYGFLAMNDGRRAYIHRNTFGGTGSLVVGMSMQVTTKPDPRNPGKWCVGEVLNVLSSPSEEPAAKRQRTGFEQSWA
mmetsp:Transcript_2716/g.8303  ORF Transcript_2716/g.8303 Transcript_2716/m.8303 type:complete len:688 (-) Transcript_2716:111-2174(-)